MTLEEKERESWIFLGLGIFSFLIISLGIELLWADFYPDGHPVSPVATIVVLGIGAVLLFYSVKRILGKPTIRS